MKAISSGKVRELFEVGDDKLLILTTNRISAFDVILSTEISRKGEVLNKISEFWFNRTRGIVPNHLISTDDDEIMSAVGVGVTQPEIPAFAGMTKENAGMTKGDKEGEFSSNDAGAIVGVGEVGELVRKYPGQWTLAKKLKMIPVECIVRGYLAGTGWQNYQETGTVWGHKYDEELFNSSKLPEPIFTPTTKAEEGHDEFITEQGVKDLIGSELATKIEELTLKIYSTCQDYARSKGIIIADTKLEFGVDENGEVVLADEVLTPDSSRFWDLNTYAEGKNQDSFDKQFIRDWLKTNTNSSAEIGTIEIPTDIIDKTRAKYLEAYSKLTGETL
jgi:phosphoribosylaminoimidazole-succinocarboxamide synthase